MVRPFVPGWRTLAPLSGTHSLQGMRKAFPETMVHGRRRNSCGRLEGFATVQVLLAKREFFRLAFLSQIFGCEQMPFCTRGWGGGKEKPTSVGGGKKSMIWA